MADFEELVVGTKRAAYEWPARTVIDAGVILAGGSDTPVTDPNWRLGVQSAVMRKAWGSGKINGPEECITVKEAIEMFTINAAWQDGMESIKGSIEVGKVADLQVLGVDILSVPPHEIGSIPIVTTMVGGKIVYGGDD